jgi:hypothetical protein
MKRKLLVVRVTLAVLAACALVPAIAAATNDPDLTFPTGTMLATGGKFKGTNVTSGPIFTSNSGAALLECSKQESTGTLTKNNGSEVEADIESLTVSGTGPEGRCTGTGVLPATDWIFNPGTNGLPWCLKSTPTMKDDEVQIRGGSCSAASRPMRLIQLTTIETFEKPTDVIECVYERTAAITGSYSTDPEDALLNMTGAEWIKTAGGVACAVAWTIDFKFLTLERDEAPASPFYIS